MEKLRALKDFILIEEKTNVVKGKEILIYSDDEEVDKSSYVAIVDEKRAKVIEDFRDENGEPLVERIKEEESENSNDNEVKTAKKNTRKNNKQATE